MSNEYGKVYKRVWGDPDFKALTAEDQLLYIKLFSQSDVSMAGVLTLAPTRWATQTGGLSTQDIERSLAALQQHGYIVIDPETQEVLLRSYIRNDGGWVSIKTLKGVTNSVRRVLSPYLRGVISTELGRLDMGLVRDTPLPSGVIPLEVVEREIGYLRNENPPQEALLEGVSDGVSRSCPPTATTTTTTTTTTTHATTTSHADAFDTFWAIFPPERKAAKKQCAAKFTKAINDGVSAETVLDAATRYRDDPNRTPAYTASPLTWLNQQRWESGPLPAPTSPQRRSTTDERVAGWLALGDQMTAPQGEPDWKGLTA